MTLAVRRAARPAIPYPRQLDSPAMSDQNPRSERQSAVGYRQNSGAEPLARRYPAMIVAAVVVRGLAVIDRRNPDLRGTGRQRQQADRQANDADQ